MKFLLSISLFFSFNSFSKISNDLAAIVNGEKITKQKFDSTYQESKLFVQSEGVSKKKILYDLINRSIGVQRGKKNKIQNDPIVREKIEDIIYHAQISKDLEVELNKIKVTDSEVSDYYKSYPEYRTAHILIRLSANHDEKEESAAMKTAVSIYKQLQIKPSRFPELANKHSQIATNINGGDIGYQPAVKLAPEYFSAIKGKKIGHITPIVKTQYGLHIIKLIAQKAYKDISKNLYKKVIYDLKRDKILDGYFKNLRKSAKIQINENLLK